MRIDGCIDGVCKSGNRRKYFLKAWYCNLLHFDLFGNPNPFEGISISAHVGII
jgi:hypothetical protein